MSRVEANVKDFFAARTLRAHTDIELQNGVKDRFIELIDNDGVPILYANHQSHADAMAIAALSEYLRNLVRRPAAGDRSLKGFATLLAASMEHGQQGKELKSTYDLLVGGARRMGVITVPITREKDEIQYGMNRHVIGELRPFVQALKNGYGIAILPEGTVQGGRHPKEKGIEDINGMQEIGNNNLIDFFIIASRVLSEQGKWPFYLPVGLHGSFRIMQAPEGGKPKVTRRGWLSLIVGVTGFSLLKIQTTLLMPFTEEEIAADLGDNWMKNGPVFNRYAMSKIATVLPPVARGVYAGIRLLNY